MNRRPLYRLLKKPANTSQDIGVISAGGVADARAHESFCGHSLCIVQRIYDQSPRQNHLGIEHGAANLAAPRNEQDHGVNFSDPRARAFLGLGGATHPVYAAFFAGSPGLDPNSDRTFVGQGYSNRTARGTAVGDEPQSMYAVLGGKHFNSGCCFDLGEPEYVWGPMVAFRPQRTIFPRGDIVSMFCSGSPHPLPRFGGFL